MKIIFEFLKGKKTYIAAIALFIYGVAANDMESVFQAMAIAGIRDAITK